MANLQTRMQAALTTFANTGSKAAALASFAYPSSMSFPSRSGGFASLAPRNTLWRNAEPLENSAVINCLAWITRNFGQAEFGVCRQTRKGDKEPIVNHPLQQLLERPNEWYGGQELWTATMLSYHLEGNAYWIKLRNARGFGVPTGIWYEPHWSIRPHWPEDGSAFIDYYERRINGRIEKIPPENVVHFRNGLNPANPRFGMAPLKGALLPIYTDQEIDAWIAALAKNMAIPGVVVKSTSPVGLTPEKVNQVKQTWARRFGGDNRGEPLILDWEAAVDVIGFDPKSMDFTALHHHAESRIAGALGVPAIVAGLTVGLDASTYNNLANLKKSAWEECLIPAYENLEDALDTHLLPDFESDPVSRGVYCEFDTSHVRALKEDQNAREERIIKRVAAGVMTVSSAQAELGLDPDPNAEYYLLPSKSTPITSEQALQRATQPPQPVTADNTANPANQTGKGVRPLLVSHKAYQWEGMILGREPSELEQLIIKQIDDAMAQGEQELTPIFLGMRNRWIPMLADALDQADPEEYADIRPQASQEDISALTAILTAIFFSGAKLIIEELLKQGAKISEKLEADLDEEFIQILTETLAARASTETAVRAVWSASQAQLLGSSVRDRIINDLTNGSTAYLESLAAEGTNSAIGKGRAAESMQRSDQIDFWIYSAVLDQATCQPCGLVDGKTGQLSELPTTPNPECLGGARCRCILIAARKPE